MRAALARHVELWGRDVNTPLPAGERLALQARGVVVVRPGATVDVAEEHDTD